ncbi:UNVERIFIED_CONTAM: nitrogen regulatory protein P-II family [Acetivibrio alkalicellulosi]
MKKLEIITRPEKLENLKELLNSYGNYGMTVSMVSGCGLQKGRKEIYRGAEYSINLLPKAKVEIVLPDKIIDEITDKIAEAVKTGEIGDGKIFIYNVENAIRIRTGEKGEKAILG